MFISRKEFEQYKHDISSLWTMVSNSNILLENKVKELEEEIKKLKEEKEEFDEEENKQRKIILESIKAIQDYTLEDAINYINYGE